MWTARDVYRSLKVAYITIHGKKNCSLLILSLLSNTSSPSFSKYKTSLKAFLCEEEGLPCKGSHFHIVTEGSHQRSGYPSFIFKLFLSPSKRMLGQHSNPLPAENFRCSRCKIWLQYCKLHLVLSIRSLSIQTKKKSVISAPVGPHLLRKGL